MASITSWRSTYRSRRHYFPQRNRKIVSRITKRKLRYENVSIRKKVQLEANTSEKRLKQLPEVYKEILGDQTGKI